MALWTIDNVGRVRNDRRPGRPVAGEVSLEDRLGRDPRLTHHDPVSADRNTLFEQAGALRVALSQAAVRAHDAPPRNPGSTFGEHATSVSW
jgi:hypothetical protein